MICRLSNINMLRSQVSAAATAARLRIPMHSTGCQTTIGFRTISSFGCLGLAPNNIPLSSAAPVSSLLRAATSLVLINHPAARSAHPAFPKPPFPPRTSPPNTDITTIASLSSHLVRLFSAIATAAAPGAEMGAPESAKTKVQRMIDENPVVLFSKTHCSYCKSSKKLLAQHNADVMVLELDQLDDGAALQTALLELTGQRTVPNVFINKKHIGGNSDLQARRHELHELLLQAGGISKL